LKIIAKYLSLIKFSHTIFALPFALLGFTMAIHSGKATFNFQKLILVILCMVFARSAAMAFNRLIDKKFDKLNPRTAIREIPSGQISSSSAIIFVISSSIAFLVCTFYINQLCFYLAPIALLVVLGYSYTKRFTPLCHLFLGAGLALAPIGAYLALAGEFSLLPILVGLVVFFWVSGFDIIYALQDEEFDKQNNLLSIPVFFGKKRALLLAKIFHFFAALLMIAVFIIGGFGWLFFIGLTAFIALLFYQHTIVKHNDLSRVNIAFFTTNGIASLIFSTLACIDLLFFK
jgi:4-hydroxybenzoate polyprenyltransferase